MAFTRDSLQNSSSSFSIAGASWIYSPTTDAAAVVVASGYFNAASQLFYPGQLIYCNCSDKTIFTRVTSANNVTPVTTTEWVPT